MLFCCVSKVDELLPEQIVERALDPESLFDAAGCPAMFVPRSCEIARSHYTCEVQGKAKRR
jgi:hypothetical protein